MEQNEIQMADNGQKNGQSRNKALIAVLIALIVVPIAVILVLMFKISSMDNEMKEMLESHSENLQAEAVNGTVDSNETTSNSDVDTGTTEQTTTEPPSTEEVTTEEPTSEKEETSAEPLPEGKYAYLTFDDGPSGNTDAILSILDQYEVKATFFVNGHTGATMEARYKAIVEKGHALGIHTYTHEYDSVYGGIESFANEVESLRKYLLEITGVDVNLFRFPGGSSNTIADDINPYLKWINDNGYSYHDWNCSSGDASGKPVTAQQIVENCMEQVYQGYTNLVILMHDTNAKDTTVEALPMLIEKLKENGYEIRAIDERSVPVHHREEQ